MGAGGFHGRVRDGIGCRPSAKTTRSSNPPCSLRLREIAVLVAVVLAPGFSGGAELEI